MADIRSFIFLRHLRADNSAHVIRYRRGKLVASGRGLSFWFSPMSTSIVEIPIDDRELPLVVTARSADFQDVAVQGVITYRVADPVALADRVDFTIDTHTGVHLRQPLEKIALYLSQLAQEHAAQWIGATPLREVLRDGPREVRERVTAAILADEATSAMGIVVASVRVAAVAPSKDLERALEAPMRERIQQEADEAAFARRALAVEKERAIQENELQNQIELSRREEQLIAQRGQNQKRQAGDEVEAKRIVTEGEAARMRTTAEAQAESLRLVEGAKVEQERARMEISRSAEPAVLAALAARELAGKLHRIDHLHIGADSLAPLLTELVTAGTKKLEGRTA
ncbi:NrtR-regulated protein NrtX [Minicystis rosea]|nr:NrtR-regulated protein NrtX [Minicystis rosea]